MSHLPGKERNKQSRKLIETDALFKEACSKTHTEQAIYWLNGMWAEGASDYAETVWEIAHIFIEMQCGEPVRYGKRAKKLKEKSDLDELQAHRVLEKLGETLTVREMRARLLKLDIDNNKRLCLIEYLVSKYMPEQDKVVEKVAMLPQGGVDPKILAEAEEKLNQAQIAMDASFEASDAATKALKEAKAAAKKSTEKLKKSQDAAEKSAMALETQLKTMAQVTKYEAEAQEAADEFEKQEQAYNEKIKKLEDKVNDKNLSTVKRGSVVAKLAALKSEDPLPLRKAKITQGAALKKVKKEKKKQEKQTQIAADLKAKADVAAEAAAEAKVAADATEASSTQAKADAEVAKEKAIEGFAEAEEAIAKIKSEGVGLPDGKIWWMERVLTEKKKFLPK